MSNPITDQEIARLEELPLCPPTCNNFQCRLLARIRSDAETISKLRDERDHYQEAFLNKQKLLEKYLNDPANYGTSVSVVAKLRKVAEAASRVVSHCACDNENVGRGAVRAPLSNANGGCWFRSCSADSPCGGLSEQEAKNQLELAIAHLDLEDSRDTTILTSDAPIDRVPEERQRPEPTSVPSGGSKQSRS